MTILALDVFTKYQKTGTGVEKIARQPMSVESLVATARQTLVGGFVKSDEPFNLTPHILPDLVGKDLHRLLKLPFIRLKERHAEPVQV